MRKVSAEYWREISPYLDRALTMEDQDRVSWLASLHQTNPAIADDLEILLEEHRVLTVEGFLDQPPPSRYGQPGVKGQILGAYRLLAPVGEGGMATVWLAERSDGRFERQAALKFLNIGLAGSGAAERFKREGSILGRLAHPNI